MYDREPSNQRQRDREVYQYLITLTDLEDRKQKLPTAQNQTGKKYSISSVAMQWGTDRMFIKRILDNLDLQEYNNTKYSNLPGLDLDKLVNILSTLRTYWQLEREKGRECRKITKREIIKAIRLFCQLSPDQESRLGLNTCQGKLLMQQLDDSINDLSQETIPKAIVKLYQYFLSIYARLRAIQQTGIDPVQYTKEILNRIDEVNALRNAENLLDSYPFSLLAMEKYIENSIFESGKYREIRKTETDIDFIDENSNYWSMTAYEAHLAIAEAYLKEGFYAVGRKYLDQIEQHINHYEPYIDSLIIARYYLSKFRYYYLIDRQGNESKVKDMLQKAKDFLRIYTQTCFAIDELPQVNFHNFNYILSRIYAHEAKIYMFMNRNANEEKRIEKLESAIDAFEQSRIHAAKEGNASLYSMWSAYQSWCYIMFAYLDRNQRENQLKWADKILNHALVCYAENGRKYYESIKANAGKSIEYEKYPERDKYQKNDNFIKIEVLPFIREINKEKYADPSNENDLKIYHSSTQNGETPNTRVLDFDLNIFTWKYTDDFGRGNYKISYLCGMPSAILLFALGMNCLCQDKISNLRSDINRAKSYFNYSWSIAEEGLEPEQKQYLHTNTVFNRRFDVEDDSPIELGIGGLYPHRITQFADFGKIFAIACELIIAIEEDRSTLSPKVDYLLAKIRKSEFPYPPLGQEKYNVHFDEIHDLLNKYMSPERLNIEKENKIQGKRRLTVAEIRDKIVGDIFAIITARYIPSPSTSNLGQ